MSYLRRQKATCGRYVPKPNESDDNPNYDDDNSIPLQDQIDNLRAKISLKEKYNKALMEEVSETNSGAAAMINELVAQNKRLREDLQYELNAEKHAVKKALRSYRIFYLAVSEKNADGVIAWLDDKIFDCAKTLNEGIYRLRQMQNKLAEAEIGVVHMEHCPIPGTEPWEMAAEETRIALESAIEHTKANRDAALLLFKKYSQILYVLKSERGKWPHLMATLEKGLSQLKNELSSLEAMLEDAIRFRDEAEEKLKMVEEEASANRKQRRHQMNKIKKSVEKALADNTAKYATGGGAAPMGRDRDDDTKQSKAVINITTNTGFTSGTPSESVFQQSAFEIKAKQQQAQEYESRATRLVEAMRVPDLRYCPKRLNTVRKVTQVLSEEREGKEEMREFLIKHKYRLMLILEYFRYTGLTRDQRFQDEVQAKEAELADKAKEIAKKEGEIAAKGRIFADLRTALIGLHEVLFNAGKRKVPPPPKQEDLRVIMKSTGEKVKELVEIVDGLNKEFPEDATAQRSYAPYVKYVLPNRYIRIGATEEQDVEEDSDQEEMIDSKIPSREEIKAKSNKIYAQAMLRRGLK